MYVLDRATGEVLSATPYVHTTIATGVDLKTGRPIEVEEKKTGFGRNVREICPSAPGGKDWQPSAFSPRTGLLYVPHNNLCMDMEGTEANYIAGTPYVGATVRQYAGPGGYRGEFTAWDPVGRKAVWKIKEKWPAWSGAVVTAGDVAFYGTMDRWFKAVHARTGEVLWRFQTGSGIIGQPVSYRGADEPGVYRGQCAEFCGLQHAKIPRDRSAADGVRRLAGRTEPRSGSATRRRPPPGTGGVPHERVRELPRGPRHHRHGGGRA